MVDDSDAYYDTQLRTITTLRTQLAFTPLDDARRDSLYRDLLWCYHETFALLYRRIGARRAARDV
jgi:hypothetical protein